MSNLPHTAAVGNQGAHTAVKKKKMMEKKKKKKSVGAATGGLPGVPHGVLCVLGVRPNGKKREERLAIPQSLHWLAVNPRGGAPNTLTYQILPVDRASNVFRRTW